MTSQERFSFVPLEAQAMSIHLLASASTLETWLRVVLITNQYFESQARSADLESLEPRQRV